MASAVNKRTNPVKIRKLATPYPGKTPESHFLSEKKDILITYHYFQLNGD